MLNLLNSTAKAYELPSTLQGFDFNPNIQLRGELASPFDSKITGYRAASYAGGFLSDYIPTTEEIKQVLQTLPSELPITVIVSNGLGKTTATRHQLSATGEFQITHFDNIEDAYAPRNSVEPKMFDEVITFAEILGTSTFGSVEPKMFDEVTSFSEILGTLKANFQGTFDFLPQSDLSIASLFGSVEQPKMFDEVTNFSEILGTLKANFSGDFDFLPQSDSSIASLFGSVEPKMFDEVTTFAEILGTLKANFSSAFNLSIDGAFSSVEPKMFDEVTSFSEILGTLKANFSGDFDFLPQSESSIASLFGGGELVETNAFMQSVAQPFEVQSAGVDAVPFAEVEIIDPTQAFPAASQTIDFVQSAPQSFQVQSAAFNALPFAEIEIIDPTQAFPAAKVSEIDAPQFISLTNLELDWV